MSRLSVAFLACLLGLARFKQTCALSFTERVVQTTNGLIIGHEAPNRSNVIEFLGIPYAQPPLDHLRFASPVKYGKSNDLHNASQWGFDCPQTRSPSVKYPGFTPQAQQIIDYFAGGSGTAQSEDCLTLNIWTQPFGIGDKLQPVLIFFHGGRFALGNTNSPFYDGQALAGEENVVVVTLTYRLNIFGFPGGPETTQNLGLRDQRVAVEWVRDNIANFGGDPSRIVIFGQSSGGAAVDYWAYAHREDPIVSGLISHSGNALSFPLNDPDRQVSNWYNVTQALGCGSDAGTLDCMRTRSWSDILQAASRLPATAGGSPVRSTPPFYPKVDGETVFSDYGERSRTGQFARLPFVLGNNEHEQGYYVIPAYGRDINVTEAQGDEFLLTTFTCPNHQQALTRRAAGVPVWQYRYFGDWENVRLYPNSGAYHGTELQMVFGNSEAVSGLSRSESEAKTQSLMQRLWADFARDPVKGLGNAGWPNFDPDAESLALLAHYGSPDMELAKPDVYAASCSLIG